MGDTTTFNMHVNKRNYSLLVKALQLAKQDKNRSVRAGVSHHIDWIDKGDILNNGQLWFTITVSRPFLIFLICSYYIKLGGKI